MRPMPAIRRKMPAAKSGSSRSPITTSNGSSKRFMGTEPCGLREKAAALRGPDYCAKTRTPSGGARHGQYGSRRHQHLLGAAFAGDAAWAADESDGSSLRDDLSRSAASGADAHGDAKNQRQGTSPARSAG